METIKNILMLLGTILVVIIFSFIFVITVEKIKDNIDKFRRRQIQKHRFNKPPLAKCYCRDCKYYNEEGGCSTHTGWRVADNWFCWDATPIGNNNLFYKREKRLNK